MRAAQGLLRASHPLPTAVVTALAITLAIGVGMAAGTVALVGLAVLSGQFSVGWSNDWLDAARDRTTGRTDKPIVTGSVTAGVVRGTALAALVVCAVASWATGASSGTLHVVAVLSAWCYNLGVKGTAFSPVPYAISFGLLPAFVIRAAGEPVPAVIVVAGALLGVGAHVANALPDLDDDAATGVRGLPHRIGRKASSVVAPLLLGAGVAVVVAGLPSRDPLVPVAAAGAAALAIGAGAVAVLRPHSRVPFVLSMAVAAVCVGLLVVAGPQLV